MEAARRLKANLRMEGKSCGWCQDALKLGDDAALCGGCDKEHHARCWDSKAGCSTAGCTNAPLRRLDGPAASASPLAPAMASYADSAVMTCPTCRAAIVTGAMVCPYCKAITSPDGLYHGPKTNAPGAVQSLVCGLIGLVFCQIILGPVAIAKASAAKKAMASDPTLGGDGLATAGMVLGIVDLVVFVLYLMHRMGNT
jgi:hypothetical protein